MKKGFTLIELLVTIIIFTIVLAIVLFFFIESQKHIIQEQEKGYLDDMAVVNLDKIREKILKAEILLEIQKKKIVLQMKTGDLDSIFETDDGVVLSERRLCSNEADSILFLWQDPDSDTEFVKDIFDIDENGILEGDEIRSLKILFVQYKTAKDKNSAELSTSIYLRK